jgi:hypothetical protein
MWWIFLLLAVGAAQAPGAAQAQVPVCIPQREGMTACFDGRLCRCRFEPGGALSARPDGHRWDCGALRPDCRTPEAAHPLPWPQHIPPPSLFLQPSAIPPPRKPS